MDLEQLLKIDGMSAIILTGAVIGAVQLIKHLYRKEWEKALIVFISALVGGLCGWMLGVGPLSGIVYGLCASGAIKLVSRVGDPKY